MFSWTKKHFAEEISSSGRGGSTWINVDNRVLLAELSRILGKGYVALKHAGPNPSGLIGLNPFTEKSVLKPPPKFG